MVAILRYVQMELDPYMTAPTVIPLPANANSSPSVKGVNDRDQVILQVGLDSDVARSYVWTAGRPLQVLEPLPGFLHSAAQDINSAGLAVGISTAGAVESLAATLWRGGQTCELRDLVTTPGLQGRQWSDAFRVRWKTHARRSRVRAVAPIVRKQCTCGSTPTDLRSEPCICDIHIRVVTQQRGNSVAAVRSSSISKDDSCVTFF